MTSRLKMKRLWILIGFICSPIFQVDCQMGCSFSSDDCCDYKNVFDGTNGPQWLRSTPPVHANVQGYIESRRSMRLNGNHPMEWPPKGDSYLYTGPTRSNTLAKKFAELMSPAIVINDTGKCLYFSYHNRIPIKLTPTLTVRMRNIGLNDSSTDDQLGESEDEILAEFYSLESSKWFEAQVSLPVGEYHLIFTGKNYNNRTIDGGVVAITNMIIADGSCGITVTPDELCAGDCGFEVDVKFCGYSYTNDSTVKLLNIFTESLSAGLQSLGSHQKPPDDRFLAMTSDFYEIANYGSRARLQSPEITIQREGCVYLWYYNSVQSKTDENNALNIIQLTLNKVEKLLFRLPIPKTHRDRWHHLYGSLPRGTYRLIIEIIYTNDFADSNFVAFDNIEIFTKSCSDVKSSTGACTSDDNENEGHRLCGTGGSCLETGKKSFRCLCNDGYYGNRCKHQYLCTTNVNPCRNGGTCFPDGRMDYRCFCQSGYTGKRCEEIQSCGSPENAVDHARVVSFTNETYGSTAQFECFEGWAQIGDLVSSCTAEGDWQTRGVCLWTRCDDPPKFPLMTLVNVTNTTIKGQATYRCHDGFMMYENQDYLTCEANVNYFYTNYEQRNHRNLERHLGRWIRSDGSSQLTCHRIPSCGQPPVIANANVTVTSVLLHGVATYRCNSGYELNMNKSSVEMNCSRYNQWINKAGNINIQCFMLPDCGPPPQIPFAVVNYANTSFNSTASYQCNVGYRLIGSKTAVCWRTGENRLKKWAEWLFVPNCEPSCPVKVGRLGNLTVAKFQVSICHLSGFETLTANLNCGPAVPYVLKRRQSENDRQKRVEKIVFYGGELCVAEKFQKIKYYGYVVVYNTTGCKSFCVNYPFGIRDIVVYDVLSYSRNIQGFFDHGTRVHDFNAGETTRTRTILRYVSLSV